MEIAPGIFDIGAQKMGYFKAGYTKAFMVAEDDGLIVIDTLYDADAQLILDEITRIGKTPQDIKHIVLTHAHRGHLGGLATLKRLSGAPIYAHEWEADIISGDRPRQDPGFFAFNPIQAWPIIFFGKLTSAWNQHDPRPVDVFIGDGDSVGPLKVIYTPGHTPGHLAFYWPEKKALFSGDAFVTWPLITPGWKSTMLNVKQSWASLEKMLTYDVQIIAPGHGEAITENGLAVLQQVARDRKI